MSQYPYPPYIPPSFSYNEWAPPQVRRPARAAGILQIIFSCMALLGGTCLSLVIFVPAEMISQQLGARIDTLKQAGVSIQQMQMIYCVFGVVILAFAITLLVLAFFVWRETKPAMIVSMVFNGIAGLVLLVLLIGTALEAVDDVVQGVVPFLMVGGMLALCGATIFKLFTAARSGPLASELAMQQAHAWAMMQQQAAHAAGYEYGNPGYGYPGHGAAVPSGGGYGVTGYGSAANVQTEAAAAEQAPAADAAPSDSQIPDPPPQEAPNDSNR